MSEPGSTADVAAESIRSRAPRTGPSHREPTLYSRLAAFADSAPDRPFLVQEDRRWNKVPRHVRFVTEFPMTATGKIQKYRLRDQAISSLGLSDVAARRLLDWQPEP